VIAQRVPSAHAIKTWFRNFEATGSILQKKGGSVKTVRTPENIAVVREAIERNPHRSARRHSVPVGVSEASVRRILHKGLHFYPCKIQVSHALHECDYVNRVNFCQTFVQLINQNQELVNNLLMGDDDHFRLSGFVNKQNFRYWSARNHVELHEKPFHSSKVTVRCAISSFGIIGPYFFEDERERAVTVTGPRYGHMLENFLDPELAHHPVAEGTFLQQDGATGHTARDSMRAVKNLFLTILSPDMGTSHGQPGHPIFQHVVSFYGVSEISSLQNPSIPHSSGVETSNSARSQTNSCGDASKSNG
jgi:hypothetical protein